MNTIPLSSGNFSSQLRPFSSGGSVVAFPLIALLGALFAGDMVHAQVAKSRPVGFLVQTIPAGQTRSFSVPFDADVSSQGGTVGRLTAVGANFIECASARWIPGAFSTAAAPYFVRLSTGGHAGRTFGITAPANTGTRLYLDTDGLDLTTVGLSIGVAGDAFEIIPGDTLMTFFGSMAAGHGLVVQGSGEPNTADLVQVWSGTGWLRYYYNTVWLRWALDTDTLADPARDNVVLRSDRGLLFTRRGGTPLDLAVVGRVLAVPQRAMHVRSENGRTFLAPMQTADTTLGALALQGSDRSVAWRGSSDAADADIVSVWSGATWFNFFFNTVAGHWQRVGDPAPNRDDFVIKAGTPVLIQRRTAATSLPDRTLVFPAAGS